MVSGSLAVSGMVVADLRRMLASGTRNLGTVPTLVKEVIRGDMWRERVEPGTGSTIGFRTFGEFVKTPPLDGLGADLALLKRVCADDAEALALLHEAATGEPGGDHGNQHTGGKVGNTNLATPVKNDRGYTVARLSEQRPDLYERVKAGNLSANAAAIEAGWRRPTLTLPADIPALARSLRRRLSDDDLKALIAHLME